jgi:CRISPR-associated protein Cmr6
MLREHDEKNNSKKELLSSISVIKPITKLYQSAYQNWHETLKHQYPQLILIKAVLKTPLAIGLGNTTPLENGFTLHHTYGTPMLPGTALKGLLRRVARAHNLSADTQSILFGSEESASHLTYWDAWLEPSKDAQPFQQDVVTVHHQNYYTSKGKGNETVKHVFPTDFDDPNPVSFLTVKKGTIFCIALTSTTPKADPWLWVAAQLAKHALEYTGIGGKTNAGYGFFDVVLPDKPKTDDEIGIEKLEEYKTRIAGINGRSLANEVRWFLQMLEPLTPIARQPLLRALLERVKRFETKGSSVKAIQAQMEPQ